MFIILGFYKRRPDLTHEQFCSHWRDVHGPLIRKISKSHPLLIRYVQHHLSPDASYPELPGVAVGIEGSYDGFSEGWFRDAAARDAFFSLPIMKTDVLEDERRFIDVSATRWVVLDSQHTIITGEPSLLTDYAAAQRLARLSPE